MVDTYGDVLRDVVPALVGTVVAEMGSKRAMECRTPAFNLAFAFHV
jgi:hypothetical protein